MRMIILIDNNKDDLQFMKEAINFVDADVQCLSLVYGEEAVNALINEVVERPDAIFMNLNMPGKNGLQCLGMIRTNRKFDDLPVAVYAAKISTDVIETLKDLGMTMSFEKPNTIREWKMVMREMLNSIQSPGINIQKLMADSIAPVLYAK